MSQTEQRRPVAGAAREVASETTFTVPQPRGAGAGIEYRVIWRREAWSVRTQSKTRTYDSREAAERFVARLRQHRAIGLSPALMRVSWRYVADWRDGWSP